MSQEQEHKKEEAEQVNAGLPAVGKLLPASNFQISRNVCIEPMEFEEG